MYNILYTLISNILFQSLPILTFHTFHTIHFGILWDFLRVFPLWQRVFHGILWKTHHLSEGFSTVSVENSVHICGYLSAVSLHYGWFTVHLGCKMLYFASFLAIKSVIVSGLNAKNCKPVMALFCTFRLAFDVFCVVVLFHRLLLLQNRNSLLI